MSEKTQQLDKLFRPQSIAIVGASPKEGNARNRLVKIVQKFGFEGRVYPITPSHAEVEGLTAYKTVADLPEVPDVALIITPAATVPGIVAECGEKGIRTAVVFSSGFEEVEGGDILAKQLADNAEKYGIALLGANGQGCWSVKHKAMMTFGGGAYAVDNLIHSPIAMISQSGALAGAMGRYLQTSGVGCSYIVSVGNETVLDALDALEWVIEQDDVKVAALYLEGLNDAHRLVELAERARERDVQIVALKTGRSAFGQEATASHTGKIASPYSIYQKVLKDAGIVLVESLEEILAAVEIFSFMPAPRVASDDKSGITILSSSGGAGALLADHCEEFGLPMARFSDATVSTLTEVLPEFARKENPIDLTGQVRGMPNLFRDAIAAVVAEQRTQAIIIQFSSSGKRDLLDNADAFKAAAAESGVPIIITFAAEKVDEATRSEFREAGILLSEDPAYSMRALSWLFTSQAAKSLPALKKRVAVEARPAPVEWQETMDYLTESGVTPASWAILPADKPASEACKQLKPPFVVKALPSEAEHKTELGLVKLRVASYDDIDAIAADFRDKLNKPNMGVLVQEMIGDGVEVVLSCLRNTDFGPVLSIGSGGVAVELYRDVTYVSLPATPAQVKTAISGLKLHHLLSGFRGAPEADIDALCEAAAKFGDLFLATPTMSEVEVNPVMVRPKGQGLAAVDFLASLTE